MKIKILAKVNLDIDGEGPKEYGPSSSIIEIDNQYAINENLQERYAKFQEHIDILEVIKDDVSKRKVEKEIENNGRTKKANKQSKK